MFNLMALTKYHSIILVAVISFSTIVAGGAYFFWIQQGNQLQTIKIGVCVDLDQLGGKDVWEGVVLAAEQINAEGGILGRQVEIIGEDTDELEPVVDMNKVSTALTRLITFHKVDYVIGGLRDEAMFMMQDIIAEHKKIFFSLATPSNELTQRVLDDYSKYKYYFRVTPPNATTVFQEIMGSLLVLREYSGFNKVAFLVEDRKWTQSIREGLSYYLPEIYNFDIVYSGEFLTGTTDFTSYFVAMEEAETEILIPLIGGQDALSVVKEWYDRQSPFVIWGVNVIAEANEYWDWTDGKCECEVTMVSPFVVGYPWTNKTVLVRDQFIERWDHSPTFLVHGAYDTVRYILYNAILKAKTTETEIVIDTLEETDIETTDSPRFKFTSSHDIMFGPGYTQAMFFQWQENGTRVPVFPKGVMEKAESTYKFPNWSGPWD